ncbi:MAG: tRNA (N(6)-L-threonylcarbamoyladenosine(37)-C(2))-methylthiotransferase MtaB [bacterium]|nr:tRNA (N(6)-L-threonylcarbamoyladenosine(37)-C(2))-methylthiotransferase MtaB [bacterium]MCP4799599.1 tRNA (N(6)-L-threonylcarbamoyladenosine(37)-C(2))-methylthiotransferase MtaB [bacterium]
MDSITTTVKIAFYTLGCRLNQYDTEAMKSALPANINCEVVPWDSDADVFIINSCTVTGKADQKTRQTARRIKNKNPGAKVVVTGCYAQTQPEVLSDITEIDGIYGISEREDISDWLPDLIISNTKVIEVESFPKNMLFRSESISDFEGKTRAFVKIQDGCNLRCSYCLIWKARGPARSRTIEDIADQIEILANSGFVELVLTGVNVGSYGNDFTQKVSLCEMLSKILAQFPKLRFRLSSIHPNEVDDELLSLFSEFKNLQPYLHLSLQSLSDTVLERMKRPYRSDIAVTVINKAAKLLPGFGIGADVIAGFPEETDFEFDETISFLESLPMSYMHIFQYSSRPGTKAELMKQVNPKIASARAKKLRQLSDIKTDLFEQGLQGSWHEAIVESGQISPGYINATLDNFATIQVPETCVTGTLIKVKIGPRNNGLLTATDVQAIDNNGDES